MSSITRDIVRAVAKEISDHDFGDDYSFDVVTPLLPRWTQEDLRRMKVSVLSRAMQIEPADRSVSSWEIDVDVVVQEYLNNSRTFDRDNRVEQLCGLVEDIAVFLRACGLRDVPMASFEGCNIEPLFDHNHLENDLVFTGRVAARYRIYVNG